MAKRVYEFTAKAVFAGEIDDVLTVMFAEEADGDGERVELQRGLIFDEQDVSQGMDTYCICLEPGAVYGGITSWSIGDAGLHLKLARKASRPFKVDEIRIMFAAKHRKKLERVIPTILVGVARE